MVFVTFPKLKNHKIWKVKAKRKSMNVESFFIELTNDWELLPIIINQTGWLDLLYQNVIYGFTAAVSEPRCQGRPKKVFKKT